jgi:hypothetical protein
MFDHRRKDSFYGICRHAGGELDHALNKKVSRRSATPPFEPVGLGGSPDRLHFGQPQE